MSKLITIDSNGESRRNGALRRIDNALYVHFFDSDPKKQWAIILLCLQRRGIRRVPREILNLIESFRPTWYVYKQSGRSGDRYRCDYGEYTMGRIRRPESLYFSQLTTLPLEGFYQVRGIGLSDGFSRPNRNMRGIKLFELFKNSFRHRRPKPDELIHLEYQVWLGYRFLNRYFVFPYRHIDDVRKFIETKGKT